MTSLGPWSPLAPAAVGELLDGFPRPWWIAGGYAIEFAVGRPLRPHDDVDVLVLRPDADQLHAVLPGWELWAADPPGTLRRWLPEEPLPARVHDIWCRLPPSPDWRFQFMVDEIDGTDWVSRRDGRLRAPVTSIGRRTPGGLPYLAPHIQLFYKAKGRRPKDELDFDAALPVLDPAQRRWLDDALALTAPEHPWRARLYPGFGS